MDDLDTRILAALSKDARVGVSTLARQMGVARTTVQARLDRLETTGVIAGYSLKLGDNARLKRIRATVLLQLEPRKSAALVTRLKALSEVEIVHTTSGRFDMVLELACGTTAALDETLDRIGAFEGVRSSESLIHLATKFDRRL